MSPDTQTFLNFFVTYVSILSLLNLLSAWSWLARRGERADGAWIKSGVGTMSTLGLAMGVKKSNWLAPGMWVIINLHAASDWLMSGSPGFWLADGLLVWETNKNAYICVAQQCATKYFLRKFKPIFCHIKVPVWRISPFKSFVPRWSLPWPLSPLCSVSALALHKSDNLECEQYFKPFLPNLGRIQQYN